MFLKVLVMLTEKHIYHKITKFRKTNQKTKSLITFSFKDYFTNVNQGNVPECKVNIPAWLQTTCNTPKTKTQNVMANILNRMKDQKSNQSSQIHVHVYLRECINSDIKFHLLWLQMYNIDLVMKDSWNYLCYSQLLHKKSFDKLVIDMVPIIHILFFFYKIKVLKLVFTYSFTLSCLR